MNKLLLSVALVSVFACSKKDDKAAPAGDDKADVADVDCDKMTTHSVELLVKDKAATLSPEDMKALNEQMVTQHADMVKACEAEKSTKPLTHKQYDCYMAATSGMVEAAKCFPQP